jgi:3'-phosphoadenosine 5'-phosphosulfate sulfotransferase (PAPS reductase)/FAD synthetase
MNYLSFGAGVNSTALMLYLLDRGVDFEAVFVNHGTDYPETYEYVQYLKDNGYRITVIKPNE